MRRIKTDRGLFVTILLSIITCGIYPFYMIYSLAQDINTVCAEDGQRTTGLFLYLVLSLLTFGIYPLIWWVKSASRIHQYGVRFGIPVSTSGVTYLLWTLVGWLVCGIGPYVALYQFLHSLNNIAWHYNNRLAAFYTQQNPYNGANYI